MDLYGEYEVSVDNKGRLRLPAQLLKQLGEPAEGGHQFVMNMWFENRLMLWPIDSWNNITRRIKKLNTFNKRNRLFVREFYKGMTPLETDSADRILLNKKLLDYAQITETVMISCQGDRIEVCSPQIYWKDENSEESYSDLGHFVMGGGDDGIGPSDDFGDIDLTT